VLKPILKVPKRLFGRLVLVVEDELMVAWDIESTLTAAGIRVLGPVSSVSTALALISQQTPDAAILDLNLLGELCTPVAQRLREMGVPFILSTAYNHLRPDGDSAFEGVDNLGKPFPPSRFLEVLDEMLG
jgi:two-component system, response regulator PdtaR